MPKVYDPGNNAWNCESWEFDGQTLTLRDKAGGIVKAFRTFSIDNFRFADLGSTVPIMNCKWGSSNLYGVLQTLVISVEAADLTDNPIVYYQWYTKDGEGDWEIIEDATDESYDITAGDYGKKIGVLVAGGGSLTGRFFLESPTVIVGSVIDATATGDAVVGETLTLAPVTVPETVAATTYEYEWYRDGQLIEGAESSTYVLVADDVDCMITGRATAVSGDAVGSGVCDPVGPILAEAPVEG